MKPMYCGADEEPVGWIPRDSTRLIIKDVGCLLRVALSALAVASSAWPIHDAQHDALAVPWPIHDAQHARTDTFKARALHAARTLQHASALAGYAYHFAHDDCADALAGSAVGEAVHALTGHGAHRVARSAQPRR